MHPISDKELDKLFQQRFRDLEVEPATDVWKNISNKMDNKKSGKQSYSIFWMAAASIVLVISAGLWFNRPIEIIKLQKSPEVAKAKVERLVLKNATNPIVKTVEKEPVITGLNHRLADFAVEQSTESEIIFINEIPQIIAEVKPVVEQTQILIASNVAKKLVASTPPKQEVKVPSRYLGDQSQLDVTQTNMIAMDDVQEEQFRQDERVNTRSKKIRNIGGLVNFVIAKVDKRDDKLIEFKDGVEGSEVSGINLGLVKIKSRK
jgi:hypothetical protein